jgi:hypothetical protein
MNASDHSRVTLDCGFGGKRVRFRKGSAVCKGSERRTLISNVRIALANIRVPTTHRTTPCASRHPRLLTRGVEARL